MERRIRVYICHCGTNIATTVDVKPEALETRSYDWIEDDRPTAQPI